MASSEQESGSFRTPIVSTIADEMEGGLLNIRQQEEGEQQEEGRGASSEPSTSDSTTNQLPPVRMVQMLDQVQPQRFTPATSTPTISRKSRPTRQDTHSRARQLRIERMMLGGGVWTAEAENAINNLESTSLVTPDSQAAVLETSMNTADACIAATVATVGVARLEISAESAVCAVARSSSYNDSMQAEKRRCRRERNTVPIQHYTTGPGRPDSRIVLLEATMEAVGADAMITQADELVGTAITSVQREGTVITHIPFNDRALFAARPRILEQRSTTTNSDASTPGAFRMQGRAFGAHPPRRSRGIVRGISERANAIIHAFLHSSSNENLADGATSNSVVAVAETVDAEAVVYASGVVKERPRWHYYALFSFVCAVILTLILGLTFGLHYDQSFHDASDDQQLLHPQDPQCLVDMVDQDIFDICHCYGNASFLALNRNETRVYEASISSLQGDELLDADIIRESCSLENQAILSFASFERLGFGQGTLFDQFVTDPSTDESFDLVVRSAVAEIIKQHFILKLLFLTTSGPAWRINDGWRTNIHMCTWKGISCNFLERVQVIRLSTNMLNGTMPWQLGEMPFLRTLDLSDNPLLTGTVPSSISRAKKLHDLELQECNFSGMLPTEIGDLPVLDRLNMASNAFNGSIPTEFGNLRRMRELNLRYNQLEGNIIDAIGNLTNLEIFNVRGNSLTGKIPSSLGQLEFLEQLDLSMNLFSGIFPKEIGGLKLLETIVLSNTQLTGKLPDSYCESDRTNRLAVVSCQGNFTLKIECSCCSTSAICAHNIPSAALAFL